MHNALAVRNIVILAYPEVQSLDVIGPLEVFDHARQTTAAADSDKRRYDVTIVSRDGAPLHTSSGLTMTPRASLTESPVEIDTLIVAGGRGRIRAEADDELIDWIAQTTTAVRRAASVGTGVFLLARAGILDGRHVTTHWSAAEELAHRHPAVEVNPEPIFLRDGPIWTSAGVTAGMDLALALMEDDLGRDIALTVARHLLLFLRRPGNQSQFSSTLALQQPTRESLREAQRFVVANISRELSVNTIAARANMSPRHFARVFRAETGITPARYVERVRLESARRYLEEATDPVGIIANACGFGTAETMRRVFLRAFGVGPAEYRRRFRISPPSIAPSRASIEAGSD